MVWSCISRAGAWHMNWVSYWNGTPSIYVCPRHKEAHDFDIAFSIVRNLPRTRGRVLDFGCGEATRARYVAGRCDKLLLWDAAPSVQDRLKQRYSRDKKIQVLSTESLSLVPEASLDLIVMSSVVQYMSVEDLARQLTTFRAWLSPHGRLILADIIPTNVGILQDSIELLRFARHERFFGRAVAGLMRTALSNYWSTRARLRLTKFDDQDMLELLRSNGFVGERLDRNFGHNQRRSAFVARPIQSGTEKRSSPKPSVESLSPAHVS